jgi:dTDP-4-amino-4,6-dideoxygalactose transaminase
MSVILGGGSHARMLGARLGCDVIPLANLEQQEAEVLESVGAKEVVIGIGDNAKRKVVVEAYHGVVRWAHAQDLRTSDDGVTVKIGEGTVVMSGARINVGAIIGRFCIINTNAVVEHDCVVEDFCHVAPGAILCGGCVIREGTMVGANATLTPCVQTRYWDLVKAGTMRSFLKSIPATRPYVTEAHVQSVASAVRAGFLLDGPAISSCEARLQAATGFPAALLVGNGALASRGLFVTLKIKFPRLNEVFVPEFAPSVLVDAAVCEKVKLRFFPLNPQTLALDTDFIKECVPTDSVVCTVHGMEVSAAVRTARPDLIFVEDAWETFPSRSLPPSLVRAISFSGHNSVSCGDGGALLFSDYTLYKEVHRHLQGSQLSNLSAALLLAQLHDICDVEQLRQSVFDAYDEGIARLQSRNVEGIGQLGGCVYAARVRSAQCLSFEAKAEFFRQRGVEIRPYFRAVANNGEGALLQNIRPDEIVLLPSYLGLSAFEQRHIVEVLSAMAK